MDKASILKLITDWEQNAGESFVDYFDGRISLPNIMFWMLGKDYISLADFNKFELDFDKNKHMSANDIFGVDSVFNLSEEEKDGMNILAEFISVSVTYQNRLNIFLSEK